MTYRLAQPQDVPQIMELYDAVIAATTGTENDPLWVKGLHPSEQDILGAIESGELLTAWIAGEGAGLVCSGDGGLSCRASVGGLDGVALADEGTRSDAHLASVAIINHFTAPGYETVPWRFCPDVPADQVATLHLFAVHPTWQGRGIARDMMAQIEQLARERGNVVLRLDTLESNRGSRAMYEKLGFACRGVAHLRYEDPRVTDFVMFEKAL